jgi:hypothetical protein
MTSTGLAAADAAADAAAAPVADPVADAVLGPVADAAAAEQAVAAVISAAAIRKPMCLCGIVSAPFRSLFKTENPGSGCGTGVAGTGIRERSTTLYMG